MTKQNVTALLWKIPACAIAYLVGTIASGIILPPLGIAPPPLPQGADVQHSMAGLVVASLVLALGVAPLAYRLRGSLASRAISLSVLLFVSVSLNTAIEATRFIAVYAKGGALNMVAYQALACILCGVALAAWIRREAGGPSFRAQLAGFFSRRSPLSWAWRIPAAVLVFPPIYFAFGMCVAAFVVPYYLTPGHGLMIPSFATMLSTAIGRSALYLLASLPVLILWHGTRRQLVLALGLAFTVMVGWFGLIQAYFFPPTLRIAHSLEICADSFVYALVLVMLLRALPAASQSQTELQAAA